MGFWGNHCDDVTQPDTPPAQRSLTLDNSDIIFTIQKGFLNASELVHMHTSPNLLYFSFFLLCCYPYYNTNIYNHQKHWTFAFDRSRNLKKLKSERFDDLETVLLGIQTILV
jgi:hypothetical protein